MQRFPAMTCCCVALCVLLLASLSASAPSYGDYESVRDLYELLLQKEALEGRLAQQPQVHEVVRKSNRSPSLRLRFGRRADPLFAGSPFSEHSVEGPTEN